MCELSRRNKKLSDGNGGETQRVGTIDGENFSRRKRGRQILKRARRKNPGQWKEAWSKNTLLSLRSPPEFLIHPHPSFFPTRSLGRSRFLMLRESRSRCALAISMMSLRRSRVQIFDLQSRATDRARFVVTNEQRRLYRRYTQQIVQKVFLFHFYFV